MRKNIYQFNREEVRRNKRRKIRRSMAKLVCVTTLSATVLSSIPPVQNVSAYAGSGYRTAGVSTVSVENAVTYDLSDSSLVTEKILYDGANRKQEFHVIDINITQNGTYIITGTNKINNAYIDTCITVAEGVEANIIFDDAHIQNDDIYCREVSSSAIEWYKELFPVMNIAGTANIYTKGNSDIAAAGQEFFDKDELTASYDEETNIVVDVTGKMIIKDSEENGTLKISGYTSIDTSTDQHGNGVYMEGGNLELDGVISRNDNIDEFVMSGGNLKINENNARIRAKKIVVSGGTIDDHLNDYSVNILCADSVEVTGGSINCYGDDISNLSNFIMGGNNIVVGGSFYFRNISDGYDGSAGGSYRYYDRYGNKQALYTLEGLPANVAITRINGQKVTNTTTTAQGKLTTFLPRKGNVIEAGGKNYYYEYDSSQEKMVASLDSSAVCRVSLRLDGEAFDELTLPKGTALGKFMDNDQYKYSYSTEDDEEFTGDTLINEDMTVMLTREVKSYKVKIDGVTKEMEYGSTLPEGYLYCADDQYRYDVYKPGYKVTEPMSLNSVPAEKENGKWCIPVKSVSDFEKLEKFTVNDPAININLKCDLNLDSENPASFVDDFYGTLNGQGHTLSGVKLNEVWTHGIVAKRLFGTVKNLYFKDIELGYEENVEGGAGVICGKNYGTIENCGFENVSLVTVKQDEDQDNDVFYADKGIITGWNRGNIRSCFTYGSTITGDGDRNEFAKDMGGTIEDCYYLSDAENESGGRTSEQFASGEVCWALNGGRDGGTDFWYQNIDTEGEKDLIPVMDPSHGTVQRGYEGCTKEYYTNNEPSKAVHDLEYQAEGNVLTATCKNSEAHKVSATITAPSDVIEYDGKEHKADVNYTYSDGWTGDEDTSYDIVYTRDGKVTTDLVSEGKITATITAGDAVASTEYTIKKTVTPSPVVSPEVSDAPHSSSMPENSGKPGQTEVPESSDTPSVTATPNPSQDVSSSPVPGETQTPETSQIPEAGKPTPAVSQTPGTSGEPTPTPGTSQTPGTSGEPTPTPGTSETPIPTPGTSQTPVPSETPVPSPDATPVPLPGNTPAPSPTGSASQKLPKVGSKIKDKDGNVYKITANAKNKKTVTFLIVSAKTKKSVTIPEKLSYNGIKYKVTGIASKAFCGNKKITKITVGKNVTAIGKKAFYNCKKLRHIKILSTKLVSGSVGSKAFGNIHPKAQVTVPKEKEKAYEKFLKKKGITGNRKVVSNK